jgi:hypothetical protein
MLATGDQHGDKTIPPPQIWDGKGSISTLILQKKLFNPPLFTPL